MVTRIITNLSNDLRVWVQLYQSSSKLGCCREVVGFAEDTHSTTKRDLHVRWLQLAVSEICRQLQTPLDVIWVFLNNTSTLKLYRDTKEVFSSEGDCIAPLKIPFRQ